MHHFWAHVRILPETHCSKHPQSSVTFSTLDFELYVCSQLKKQPKNPKNDQFGCNGPFWSLNVPFQKISFHRVSHPQLRVDGTIIP